MRIFCFLMKFHQDLRGKVYPYARIKPRKYIKSPEGLTEIGKVLRALFSLPKSVFKRVTRNNNTARKGSELMIRPILRDCAKYARGPPKWISSDSLFEHKIEKVNQIWFTLTPSPNAACVGLNPHIGHGREVTYKTAVWRVCGAVGRREPYNLILENKTYYTQNYDNMR